MLQAVRSNQGRKRVAIGKTVPAPTGGWDKFAPLAAMPPDHAIQLQNWFPQPGYIEVRRGSRNWVTGLTDPVESLMPYHGLTEAGSSLKAAAGTSIFDVTSTGAVGAAELTSLTNSRWQHINYTTSGGVTYLFVVNGADSARHWNGSAWATPSITGILSNTWINVNVFKKYIWGVVKDSMNACYLPLDSVAGAATAFPLGSVMQRGGYLVAMATWSPGESGVGPEDYAVFVSSRGQVAIYSGTNPASDFALLGVYDLASPIGYRCTRNMGGDLAILTLDGIMPLSRVRGQDVSADTIISVTKNIHSEINTSSRNYGSNYGWQMTVYPKGKMLILNVPVDEGATQYQYVMNTLTGAWCLFTGWNANCFAVYRDNLYFGGNSGTVLHADYAAQDVSTAIFADGQQAYNYFGDIGRNKKFGMIQPIITIDSGATIAVGLSTDFNDNFLLATPTSATTASSLYDSAVYDSSTYDATISSRWTSLTGIGHAGSIHFACSTNSSSDVTARIDGFNVTYEPGEFV